MGTLVQPLIVGEFYRSVRTIAHKAGCVPPALLEVRISVLVNRVTQSLGKICRNALFATLKRELRNTIRKRHIAKGAANARIGKLNTETEFFVGILLKLAHNVLLYFNGAEFYVVGKHDFISGVL